MNTNDFYKELFEKYALNEDKIRRNAIKAAKTPAWKRTLGDHWKTFAGAAAAVAVTVGAVAYTTAKSGDGIDIVSQENVLSASQRLHNVEQNYYNVSSGENESGSDIYVSMKTNISYSDLTVALSAVSDNEDITVCRLYLDDSTVIDGDDIKSFAESGSGRRCIIGAKLYAPVKYYKDIQQLSPVYVAELGSEELNDRTFSPLPYDDGDPLANDYEFVNTTAATPSATTTPFEFVSETTSAVIVVTVTSDSSADTTEPPEITEANGSDETSDGETTGEQGEYTESTSGTDISSEPAETSAVSETTPSTSETTLTVSSEEIIDPPEIGLISQIYQLNVENATDTVLIGDHAIVLARSNVYFYHLGGIGSMPQAQSTELSSPKIIYSDENTVMLSGCGSSGLRNIIVSYDMKNDKVYVSDASANLGSAEIGIVQYSSAENKFFMKAVTGSMTYFYEITITGEEGIQFRPLFEHKGAVSTAGYRNGTLWFTAADDSMNYSLYAFDCTSGQLTTVKELGASCKVRRSLSLESFLIFTEDSNTGEQTAYVYNVNNMKFIPVSVDGDAQIAVSGDTIYIRNGDKVYSVASDGVLTESRANVRFAAKLDSRYIILSSGSDRIEIAERNPNSWN